MQIDWKIAAGLGWLLSSNAMADTVVLENGDRLTGTLVRMEGASLWLDTAYAGTLKLPWVRVERIETDAPVRLILTDGTELAGHLDGSIEGQLRLGGATQRRQLRLDRIHAINPPPHPDDMVLTGRAAVGGTLSRGNNDAETLHVSGELVARKPNQRVTLNGESTEAAREGTGTVSNWRIGAKYDYFFSPRAYSYANTRFDHDRYAGLDLRSTAGIGAGRQFIERRNLKLSLEGGATWVKEDYAAMPDERFPSVRVGLKYEQTVWQGRLQLFHTSDVLVNLDAQDDYLYQGRSGVRMPVGKQFSLGTQLNLDYDAVPAEGKDTTDSVLLVKLDYTL